jgi:tetratricopeptide (TPR) repeat protein
VEQESNYALAMQALERQEYQIAWDFLEAESDDFWQASGRANAYFSAGDNANTMLYAKAALDLRQNDLPLLYRASWAAVALGDRLQAEGFVGQLSEALRLNPVDPQHAEGWNQSLAELESSVVDLQQSEQARVASLGRARSLSLVGLVGVVLLIGWIGRR